MQAFEKRQTEGMATFPYRYQAAKQKYPDFEETITKATNVELPVAVIDALKICPEGPDVAYYLGKHPEVARELNQDWQSGNAVRQKRVCDRLDYISNGIRFQEAHPQRMKRPITPAPEPIRPLGGASATRSTQSLSDPDMPYSEYKRIRDQQEYGRGGGRR